MSRGYSRVRKPLPTFIAVLLTPDYFAKIRAYLLELGFDICHASEAERVLVVDRPELGIRNLVVGCGDPLLILEQYLLAAGPLGGHLPPAASEKPRHHPRRLRPRRHRPPPHLPRYPPNRLAHPARARGLPQLAGPAAQ